MDLESTPTHIVPARLHYFPPVGCTSFCCILVFEARLEVLQLNSPPAYPLGVITSGPKYDRVKWAKYSKIEAAYSWRSPLIFLFPEHAPASLDFLTGLYLTTLLDGDNNCVIKWRLCVLLIERGERGRSYFVVYFRGSASRSQLTGMQSCLFRVHSTREVNSIFPIDRQKYSLQIAPKSLTAFSIRIIFRCWVSPISLDFLHSIDVFSAGRRLILYRFALVAHYDYSYN